MPHSQSKQEAGALRSSWMGRLGWERGGEMAPGYCLVTCVRQAHGVPGAPVLTPSRGPRDPEGRSRPPSLSVRPSVCPPSRRPLSAAPFMCPPSSGSPILSFISSLISLPPGLRSLQPTSSPPFRVDSREPASQGPCAPPARLPASAVPLPGTYAQVFILPATGLHCGYSRTVRGHALRLGISFIPHVFSERCNA